MIYVNFYGKKIEKKKNEWPTNLSREKIRYLWSDTQKSVIMELLAAC